MLRSPAAKCLPSCPGPAVIFKCKGASADEGKVLGRRNGPLEETAEADNKKKKSACEAFGPGACADNRDRCSLCKEKMSGVELCFRPSVATKLPPCEPWRLLRPLRYPVLPLLPLGPSGAAL